MRKLVELHLHISGFQFKWLIIRLVKSCLLYIKNLRCAKTMVEKANQALVPIWWDGGPRNSSFIRCSRTQTTKPMKTKKQALVTQRSHVKGFMKTHAFLFLLFTRGTIIDTPDSVYGNVKSTYCDLFHLMVTSPATTSNFCYIIYTPQKTSCYLISHSFAI